MTLADFLLARIAEDEAEANWRLPSAAASDRLRAECEAKRRIVELHRVEVKQVWMNPPDGPGFYEAEHSCVVCDWFRTGSGCETVLALALPYADHPDYRAEWRR